MGSLDPDRLLAIIETQTAIVSVFSELDSVMEIVLERARALTGASFAVIELLDGEEIVYHMASGPASSLVGLRLRLEGSLSGHCLQEGRLVHSRNAQRDPRVDTAAAQRVGAASLLCVPLTHRDGVAGILKVCHILPDAFTQADEQTLELLARLIGAAMANANAFELQRHESRHDLLTALPNRRAFEERLESEIARTRRYGGELTVCLADLDRFKAINDRRGHAAGDAVLQGIATHLAELRGGDEAFRYGGDEFAVIFPGVDPQGARIAMSRVQARVRRDPACRGVGISWGLATLADHVDAATLLAAADSALYEVKRARKSRPSTPLSAAVVA